MKNFCPVVIGNCREDLCVWWNTEAECCCVWQIADLAACINCKLGDCPQEDDFSECPEEDDD
jgi:hypothetical protein